jgi:hypothetical protein
MAKGIVASLRGDWSAVVNAVNAVFDGANFILLAEDADATKPPHFCWATALDQTTCHPRGRAFDQTREVRWRETGAGRFTATYLSETTDPPASAGFEATSTEWQTRRTCQKLYGKWSKTTGDWVEVMVPGTRGKYRPVIDGIPTLKALDPPPNALTVEGVDYFRDGVLQLTRFRAIEKYS